MSKPLTASRIACTARESHGAWVGVVYGDGLPIWTSPLTGSFERGLELAKQHRNDLLGFDPYEPNTIEWPKGTLVLHVADSKETDTLLRVIGKAKPCEYTGKPVLRLQYVYPRRLPLGYGGKSGKRVVFASIDKLLDPARFGVDVAPQQVAA